MLPLYRELFSLFLFILSLNLWTEPWTFWLYLYMQNGGWSRRPDSGGLCGESTYFYSHRRTSHSICRLSGIFSLHPLLIFLGPLPNGPGLVHAIVQISNICIFSRDMEWLWVRKWCESESANQTIKLIFYIKRVGGGDTRSGSWRRYPPRPRTGTQKRSPIWPHPRSNHGFLTWSGPPASFFANPKDEDD